MVVQSHTTVTQLATTSLSGLVFFSGELRNASDLDTLTKISKSVTHYIFDDFWTRRANIDV